MLISGSCEVQECRSRAVGGSLCCEDAADRVMGFSIESPCDIVVHTAARYLRVQKANKNSCGENSVTITYYLSLYVQQRA